MDYPYILFFLILLVLTCLSFKIRDFVCYKTAACIVFLFLGLRAPVVGADTWGYYRLFTGEIKYLSDIRDLEIGFRTYNYILKIFLLKQGQLYMLFNTFFSLFIIHKLIEKYSLRKTLSVFLFFCIVSWLNYFIALRQILGLSILLIGVLCVASETSHKWLLYFVFSIMGWLFHTSTIIFSFIFALLYFVRGNNRWIRVALIVLSVYVGVLLKSFDVYGMFTLLFSSGVGIERLENYGMNPERLFNENTNSIITVLFPSIFSIVTIMLLPKRKISHWFTNIYVTGVCVHNFFIDFTIVGRMIIPFSLFGIIVYTWIFERGQSFIKNRLSHVMTFLFLLIFIRGLIKQSIEYDKTSDDRMHPYYFFWQDYHDHPSIKYS